MDYRNEQQVLSELTESKAKLERYRIRAQAMFNSLGEGLIVTDENGQINSINDYALKALGYEEEEIIGGWLPKTVIAVDQYAQPIDQLSRPIVRCLTTGQTVSARSHYLTKRGSVLPIHITVSPILIDGLPAGAIEVFRDLTAEQQLDIAKEEFVSLASHQLRTPATAVKSILSMLQGGDFGPLSEVQQVYIEKAAASNNRQLQIIEDLLNVAMIDSGKMELDLQYLNLAALIHEAVSDHQPTIEGRNQNLSVQTVERANLLIDPQKMRMVIDNLLSNASKYSPPNTTVNLSLTTDKDCAMLKVKDQGVGIAGQDIPKLFTKFQRLPNELSGLAGGTGLGLFLTKSITDLHHGSLSVESTPGVGTTFTVTLPLKWSART
jgi:PAS domain S-box-containing protein